ncbi:hypothetical protein KCU93_g208, partial [Aureobasidium melanogenum]
MLDHGQSYLTLFHGQTSTVPLLPWALNLCYRSLSPYLAPLLTILVLCSRSLVAPSICVEDAADFLASLQGGLASCNA